MGTSPGYDAVAVVLSVLALGFALTYLVKVVTSYRFHRDHRAAVALVKAVGLSAMAIGMLVSAFGLVTEFHVLSVAGLSLARGVFIVLLATLVVADTRP